MPTCINEIMQATPNIDLIYAFDILCTGESPLMIDKRDISPGAWGMVCIVYLACRDTIPPFQ